jgi:hypothetical protein
MDLSDDRDEKTIAFAKKTGASRDNKQDKWTNGQIEGRHSIFEQRDSNRKSRFSSHRWRRRCLDGALLADPLASGRVPLHVCCLSCPNKHKNNGHISSFQSRKLQRDFCY